MAERLSYEEVKSLFTSRGFTLLEENYVNSRTPMRYICVCGNESKMNYSNAKLGRSCFECRKIAVGNANRKYTIEDVRKLFSDKNKTLLENEFINSHIPMKYICKCGRQSRINLNGFLRGADCFECGIEKNIAAQRDYSITEEERAQRRKTRKDGLFRRGVFKRDDFTCQCCKQRGGKLNAHHIFNFAHNPELRTDIDNGITLCQQCHRSFHTQYGNKNTNYFQLAEFRNKGGVRNE